MKSGRLALCVILLAIGLVALNYLASAVPFRADATAGDIYTLSPGTKTILARLEEPIRLDFYFSAGAAGLRAQDKNYAARVEEMLRQYVRAGRGRVELSVIDPKPDTPAEEQAAAAGLAPQPLPTGETVYFGLVATHADKREVIEHFVPDREPFLEYDLTRAIHSVQLFTRPKLGLISALPLRAQPDFMAMQAGRMPRNQLVLAEWERNFEVVPVDAAAAELPGGLDALAVVHPPALPEKLQFAIDQFLLGGKPVFLALDPSARTVADRGRQQMMMGGPPPGATSDLPKLLAGWGLAYDPAHVVGDFQNATPVSTGDGRVGRFPHWVNVGRGDLDPGALATSQLESLLFVEPGAIGLKDGVTGLTLTPLARSSEQAGFIPASSLLFSGGEDAARSLTASGRKTIAAIVQGKFRTAFPEGAPKDLAPADEAAAPASDGATRGGPAGASDEPAGASAASAPPAPAALKESAGTSTLFVVADADWLMDSFSVRRLNFLGMEAYEPLNDNLAFATNAVEFVAGAQDLITLRGKDSSLRPFTVVRRMQATAQQRYQEQLSALEARLNEVQGKLAELQGRRTEGNRLVAPPEVTKAIEDFQRQQAAMRSERRQIRAALRADIEKLEYGLAALNLVLPVALVGAFGLWFRRHRRSGARA
ncbi:MAG TPA: GldG family protein [Opitutaceae bacterium]|nr:GldG family protein [Opitutaceae bacterium]